MEDPRLGALASTEPRDERCIDRVGLGPQQLALREGFDAGRIDYANTLLEPVEIRREGFPIGASRLHADVHVDLATIFQPAHQLLESLWRVRKRLLCLSVIA